MSVEDADETSTVVLDESPPVTSSIISIFAAVIAVVVTAPSFGFAIPLGIAGLLFIATGVFTAGSRRWVSLGVTSIFVGILLVGALGAATPLTMVTSAVALFVSWDVGQHAVTIGEQFGRGAPTQRGELVHAAASSLVGVLGAGVAYAVYLLGTGDQPALAVILLLLGVVALVWALRD
jgi:hypothetical protein